jgi:tRNA(Ile)-lysidine synthase
MNSEFEPQPAEHQSHSIIECFERKAAALMQDWAARKSRKVDISERPWILAVSGGADSMAMLHALHRSFAGQRMIVAHMNHHARAASDDDEAFVRHVAGQLGIEFEAGHWRPARKSHFEIDARNARHNWLAQLAERIDASAILTAHTLDDQVETVLMRLARGAGPSGLAGIRPCRKLSSISAELVRPMLRLRRTEILEYSNALGIVFREDPTNSDIENQTRAWVRHVLVPQFESRLNPKFREAVSHFAELQEAEQHGLDQLVTDKANQAEVAHFEAGSLHISLPGYNSFGPSWLRIRMLRSKWSNSDLPQLGMTLSHWRELDRRIVRAAKYGEKIRFELPSRVMLEFDHAHAVISRTDQDFEIDDREKRPDRIDSIALPCPGAVEVGDFRFVTERSIEIPNSETILQVAGTVAMLDVANVRPPLVVRHPIPGDRFDPLGMGGKHQKLTDYLRVRCIKGRNKMLTWIVEDQEGILWVVGHGISQRAVVGPKTEAIWKIRVENSRMDKGGE